MAQHGKTGLVTGAAQGIGASVAQRLVKEGVTALVLIDRDAAGLERTAAALKSHGATCHPLPLDLMEIATAEQKVAAKLSELGGLDVLVNAAGLTDRGGLGDTDQATFDRLFAVNTRAPFFMMQTAAPFLKKNKGVIVNVTSMLAYGGPPFLLAYSASKAALVAITKGTANALKRDRVRAFAINLGWTFTPSEQKVQTEKHGMPQDWAETIGAKQPFGRLLLPEDVADLIAFLMSPGASMMTGAVIDLDQYVAGTIDDNPGNAG
jgi:NAD(P)-dependent dehydrogenase (short-subunit alcohol dehydrogenase family)